MKPTKREVELLAGLLEEVNWFIDEWSRSSALRPVRQAIEEVLEANSEEAGDAE